MTLIGIEVLKCTLGDWCFEHVHRPTRNANESSPVRPATCFLACACRRKCSKQLKQTRSPIITFAVDEEGRRTVHPGSDTTHEIFPQSWSICSGLDLGDQSPSVEP